MWLRKTKEKNWENGTKAAESSLLVTKNSKQLRQTKQIINIPKNSWSIQAQTYWFAMRDIASTAIKLRCTKLSNEWAPNGKFFALGHHLRITCAIFSIWGIFYKITYLIIGKNLKFCSLNPSMLGSMHPAPRKKKERCKVEFSYWMKPWKALSTERILAFWQHN